MMKLNIDMDKRAIVLIGTVAAAGVVFLLFLGPLWAKARKVSQEVQALGNELSSFREVLSQGSDFSKDRRPLSRGRVSVAINEIMEKGASLDIDFFSTSPQQIQKRGGSKYPVLPIRFEMQSSYKNFGIFLGALEKLDKSIVTVKQFHITRKPVILPEIHIELVVDVYLKEGEGG